MPKTKRTRVQSTQHDKFLENQLKRRLTLAIAIPLSILFAFILFGPQIASVFEILSQKGTPTEKKIAVAAPIFDNPPSFAKERNVTLNGFAKAGATVRLYVNGPEAQSTVVTNDGTFTFENVELNNGKNTIFAKAFDQDGRESDKSQTVTITIDNDAPKIEVESPKDGEVVKNLNNRITIIGKVNEKAQISVNDKLAILKPDLSFEITLGVEEGTLELKIKATDEAGNESTKELTVTYDQASE